MCFAHVINNCLAFCHFLYLKIRENQLISTSSAGVQCDMEFYMENGHFSRVSLPSAVLWGAFSILHSLDACSSGSCVGDKVQQHMLCFCLEVVYLIGGWTVRVHYWQQSCYCFFSTRNCSVMGTEISVRQMERQQKAFRFNKVKVFALARLSSFFCFNFVVREWKNVALIKEINCKQVLILLILVCVCPFSCIC